MSRCTLNSGCVSQRGHYGGCRYDAPKDPRDAELERLCAERDALSHRVAVLLGEKSDVGQVVQPAKSVAHAYGHHVGASDPDCAVCRGIEVRERLRAELERVKREVKVNAEALGSTMATRNHLRRELDSARADNAALEAKLKTAADAHPGCGLLDDLAGECQCKAREQRLRVELERTKRERDALAEFKAYTHRRLDRDGVEENPPGEHTNAGCRIGQRLSVVFAERDAALANEARLREALEGARSVLGENRQEWCPDLRRLDTALAATDSREWLRELLTRAAEAGRVAQVESIGKALTREEWDAVLAAIVAGVMK